MDAIQRIADAWLRAPGPSTALRVTGSNSQLVTNLSEIVTVLWLNQHGMDIRCVRIKPHKVGDQIIVVPSKIISLQEVQQYQVEIQQKKESRQQKSYTKCPTTIKLSVESDQIKIGQKIYLERFLPDYLLPASRSDLKYVAEITGKLGKYNAVRWLFDNKEYSISNLTHTIFQTYHPTNKHPAASGWHLLGCRRWTVTGRYGK